MNDGASDPQGRFWAGTLADDFRPGGGALYRLDQEGRVALMLDNLTISNGLPLSSAAGRGRHRGARSAARLCPRR